MDKFLVSLGLCGFFAVYSLAGTLSSESEVEVNLGPIPIDHYTDDNDSVPGYASLDFVKDCTETTVRDCYQAQLAELDADGVTGIRFMFYFCGGAWSTALDDCLGTPSLNSDWVDNLELFLEDVADAGIDDVTPTPQFWGGFDSNLGYCDPILSGGQVDFKCGEDDGEYNFLTESDDSTLNDGLQWDEVSDSCTSTTLPLFFWPAAPFGVRGFNSDGDPVGPWMGGYNDAYNCSPSNPDFVGWNNIYDVVEAVI